MIYKTLHGYILRELLRIFLLTAAALTTLLAFGGTFKPLTKEGIDVGQLMLILLNLMPAMLAYAIPLAALFAAVLVYWRLSTDNEITACRAGGVSFWAIVMPALLLGLIVASADLVFVNYVVPVFLQRAEETVRRDLGTLLVHNIARQEPFEFEHLVVYADDGQQHAVPKSETPEGVDERTIVVLHGMAATQLDKDKKAAVIIVARQANVIIDQFRRKNEVHIVVQLEDGSAFDPQRNFQKVSGTIRSLPPEGFFPVPSFFQDKPKFLNFYQLRKLEENVTLYGPVAEIQTSILQAQAHQETAQRYLDKWQRDKVLRFDQNGTDYFIVRSPTAVLDVERQLIFNRAPADPVQIDQYRNGRMVNIYRCDTVSFLLADDSLLSRGPAVAEYGTLQLSGNVVRQDLVLGIPPAPGEKMVALQPLIVPPEMVVPLPQGLDVKALQRSSATMTPSVLAMVGDLRTKITKLVQSIGAELHSRGSFALSCLTLVLLGAALGIEMRGRNPLVVFVVGFVPAIVLVLLITAGRKMVESSGISVTMGYAIIWAGNLLLLALVAGVYARLLRH